jgi:deoxycytidine triphosphate deaminase
MIILKRNFLTRGIIIENSQDDDTEHVTIDLTVGDQYQVAGQAEWHQLDHSYTLVPNRCILVRTRERVMLPANIFGVLCSKGSLSARGLIISNTKVDPIFGDYLSIPLFNAGGSPLEIKAGMKFCSIYFQELEQSIPQLAYRKAVIQWTTKRNPFKDFLRMNSGLIVSSLLASICGALITVGFYPNKREHCTRLPNGSSVRWTN